LISGSDLPKPLDGFSLPSETNFNNAELTTVQLLELIRHMSAENEKLHRENAQLRAEIEALK